MRRRQDRRAFFTRSTLPLLFVCCLYFSLSFIDRTTTSGETVKDPLPLREGCVAEDDASLQPLSERTRIPQLLEDAYLKLDAHLDMHAPLKGRLWQEERPAGVAALRLEGMKVNFLWKAIHTHIPNCRTVCEVGLNAGHSSILWMQACPQANAVLFDMPYKKWSHPAFDFLRSEYEGRLEITEGNSLVSIPDYIQQHPNLQCDLVAIDGSKDPAVRLQDFLNLEKVSHRNTLLLLDDASIEMIKEDYISNKRDNLIEALHTNGDLNGLYASLIVNRYIRLEGACSIPGATLKREDSTISAHYSNLNTTRIPS